jgi:hypothetical protein
MLDSCVTNTAWTLAAAAVGVNKFGSVLTVDLFILGSIYQAERALESSMSSGKRSGIAITFPLDDAGILLRVLNVLGPGQHLLISAVSKAWRESYARVDSAQIPDMVYFYNAEAHLMTITPEMTLYSAVFTSAALVKLAHEHGLALKGYNGKLERIAGRVADVNTLRAAHELGLQLTDEVLYGAAECLKSSVHKLQWLHDEHGCELVDEICSYAVRSGSIETLSWLKDHGIVFSAITCEGAAAGAHLHVLQYLRKEGCEWDSTVCSAAAQNGHLAVLQWLHEQGCPWYADYICSDAAETGSMEMLLYLKQKGCEYNADTISGAAGQGQLSICQYLVAEQCPCEGEACEDAARGGHLETVRFLRESGCPWDATAVCEGAAWSGNIELLQYLRQQGCTFGTGAMSTAAQRGHLHVCQYLRAEQCPWTAQACSNAAHGNHLDTLRWLHEQGCPLDISSIGWTAAVLGRLPVLELLVGAQPAPSVAQLTMMLATAGARKRLGIAKFLREHGAEWPAVLVTSTGLAWSDELVQWARSEGCTSPLPPPAAAAASAQQ